MSSRAAIKGCRSLSRCLARISAPEVKYISLVAINSQAAPEPLAPTD